MARIPHIIDAEPLDGDRLRLTFDDGVVGEVDIADELWGPMFEPLREPAEFAKVQVDPEMGTVSWPNGADLDPCTLHEMAVAGGGTSA